MHHSFFRTSFDSFGLMIKEDNATYEAAAHIFLTAIRSARRNLAFGMLSRQSQNKILGKIVAVRS